MATETLDGLSALLRGLDLGGMPQFPSADVLHQPIDIFHVYLADTLQKLVGCDPQHAYEAIQPADKTSNGDLDIVLPKLKLPGGPDLHELAADLVKKFPTPHPLFVLPWRDGIHIRFYFSPKVLPKLVLPYILDRGHRYGILADPTSCGKGVKGPGAEGSQSAPQKKALVEFSSPNLGQDFRTDHLRSTILGGFIANMYEAMGWHVVRINYLGDWGKHIGLLGIGWVRYGSEEVLENHADPFRYLHEVYARMEDELKPKLEAKKKRARDRAGQLEEDGNEDDEIFGERDATFKKLEEGDTQAVELWEKLRRISIAYYVNVYRRIGVQFDDYPGESLVCRNPEAILAVEARLRERDISDKAPDGSWIIDFGKYDATRLGAVTIRSKDGTSTYFLRDLATVCDRMEDYNFSTLIYVVGEQDLHFRQVFKTIELMGHVDIAENLQHLAFTRGPSRWGKEQLLGDILDRCEEYMQRALAESSQVPPQLRNLPPSAQRNLAINSLIVLELNNKNKAHTIGLDAEMLMSTEGETGLSLQLSYARLSSALEDLEDRQRKYLGSETKNGDSTPPEPDYLSLADNPWVELPRLLVRYPARVQAVYKSLEPSGLMSYLFQVLEEVCYCLDETGEGVNGIEDVGDSAAVAARYAARILLFECTKQVVLNAMRLLGIIPINR